LTGDPLDHLSGGNHWRVLSLPSCFFSYAVDAEVHRHQKREENVVMVAPDSGLCSGIPQVDEPPS